MRIAALMASGLGGALLGCQKFEVSNKPVCGVGLTSPAQNSIRGLGHGGDTIYYNTPLVFSGSALDASGLDSVLYGYTYLPWADMFDPAADAYDKAALHNQIGKPLEGTSITDFRDSTLKLPENAPSGRYLFFARTRGVKGNFSDTNKAFRNVFPYDGPKPQLISPYMHQTTATPAYASDSVRIRFAVGDYVPIKWIERYICGVTDTGLACRLVKKDTLTPKLRYLSTTLGIPTPLNAQSGALYRGRIVFTDSSGLRFGVQPLFQIR